MQTVDEKQHRGRVRAVESLTSAIEAWKEAYDEALLASDVEAWIVGALTMDRLFEPIKQEINQHECASINAAPAELGDVILQGLYQLNQLLEQVEQLIRLVESRGYQAQGSSLLRAALDEHRKTHAKFSDLWTVCDQRDGILRSHPGESEQEWLARANASVLAEIAQRQAGG